MVRESCRSARIADRLCDNQRVLSSPKGCLPIPERVPADSRKIREPQEVMTLCRAYREVLESTKSGSVWILVLDP